MYGIFPLHLPEKSTIPVGKDIWYTVRFDGWPGRVCNASRSSRSRCRCGSQWASCRGTIWLARTSPGVPCGGLGEVGSRRNPGLIHSPVEDVGTVVEIDHYLQGFGIHPRWFSRRISEASTVLSFDTTRVLVPEWMHWHKLVPSEYQGSNR